MLPVEIFKKYPSGMYYEVWLGTFNSSVMNIGRGITSVHRKSYPILDVGV